MASLIHLAFLLYILARLVRLARLLGCPVDGVRAKIFNNRRADRNNCTIDWEGAKVIDRGGGREGGVEEGRGGGREGWRGGGREVWRKGGMEGALNPSFELNCKHM